MPLRAHRPLPDRGWVRAGVPLAGAARPSPGDGDRRGPPAQSSQATRSMEDAMTSERAEGRPGWVLVTGGSRGIGKGIVEHLCRCGYDVVFTYRAPGDAARLLAARLATEELRCEGIECDGSDDARVQQAVAALLERKGPPYALMN